jgi:predicted deacetylase
MSQRHPHATRQLVVALHDVAPPFEDAIRAQLDLLAAIGVRRVSLLVTPDWHGDAPLYDAPGLVKLLRAQVAAGSQLVLHGYTHQPAPGAAYAGPWPRQLRARLFARNAAEFLTLAPEEAEALLRQGLADFEQVGLPRPTTFCAPGWLSNAAAEAALTRAGLRYLISMLGVRDLWSDWRIQTPAVGYMGAGSKQELGVQTLNMLVRWTTLPTASVACVYLHPQSEPTGPRVRRQIALVSKLLARGWQLATYDGLFSAGSVALPAEPDAQPRARPARHAS